MARQKMAEAQRKQKQRERNAKRNHKAIYQARNRHSVLNTGKSYTQVRSELERAATAPRDRLRELADELNAVDISHFFTEDRQTAILRMKLKAEATGHGDRTKDIEEYLRTGVPPASFWKEFRDQMEKLGESP